jgi:uncharacterized protein (TIGR02996 family)
VAEPIRDGRKRLDDLAPDYGPSDIRTESFARFMNVGLSLLDIDAGRTAFSYYADRYETMIDTPFDAAITQQPGEDTPRLMAADWLDERADDTPAPYCAQLRARAELIRLMISITNGPNCAVCAKTGRYRGTHGRYCDLMHIDVKCTDIAPDKFVDIECPVCDYYKAQHRVRFLLDTKYAMRPVANRATRADDLKVTGKELWRPFALLAAREVRYVRGFVGLASYKVSDWYNSGAKAVRAAPLELVIMSDRPLRRSGLGKIGYLYAPYGTDAKGHYPEFTYPSCVVPEDLFDLACTFREKDRHTSPDDCYRWLSFAALYRARKEAGLPDWIPRNPAHPIQPMLKPGLPQNYFDRLGHTQAVTKEYNPELYDLWVSGDPGLDEYKGFSSIYEDFALDFDPEQLGENAIRPPIKFPGLMDGEELI